jgi:NitT/TauT family transport system ATP-binding protein
MVTHDIDEAVLMADRALIMAGAPGKIMHDIRVDLPDPRGRQDEAVQAMRSHLMETFQEAANAGVPKVGAGDDAASETLEDGITNVSRTR